MRGAVADALFGAPNRPRKKRQNQRQNQLFNCFNPWRRGAITFGDFSMSKTRAHGFENGHVAVLLVAICKIRSHRRWFHRKPPREKHWHEVRESERGV